MRIGNRSKGTGSNRRRYLVENLVRERGSGLSNRAVIRLVKDNMRWDFLMKKERRAVMELAIKEHLVDKI